MSHKASRFHDISCGHRVVGHENKCRHLHGHNYRIHFYCQADVGVESLDKIGRVIDFGEIKSRLCMWVENNWDHKFLAWELDPVMQIACAAMLEDDQANIPDKEMFCESLVFLPFNPTAENMAQYLVEYIGPKQLEGTGIKLIEVVIEETAKCHASFSL